ncbi:MAG: outer membrane beta-barrel protein, partial [Prevotella sp.]|nr:outer membrane beta-barrel protein [Candidatus Prevotella equi]
MKKTLFTIIMLIASTFMAMAQEGNWESAVAVSNPSVAPADAKAPQTERLITGTIIDKETKESVMQATIQLLKAEDSTYVAGAVTNEDGQFRLVAPSNGKYIIKMTNIGYKQVIRNVTIADNKDFSFGKINMETDAVLLKEVVANGIAAKVVVKEDTFIYNAAAYRTPEGSVVEELVKRLPGAQIDENGKITINGKEVKKIKVDGKEFMTGDTQTALKNLPTAIVEKVKAYDEKSDLAKMTGVDDGEETTILDFGIKRGMNKGFMSNVDLAIGTKLANPSNVDVGALYSGRAMAGYMKDTQRLFFMGNMNNTNDRGFGRGGGGGASGLQSNKMLSLNYNYEKRNKFKLDFSARWNHGNNNRWSKTESENFVGARSFSNSISQNNGRNNNWNLNANIEWKPDTMTTIQLRPSFSTSSSDSKGASLSASFNDDPYKYVEDMNYNDYNTLKSLVESVKKDSILVNRNENNSLSYSHNTNFNIQGTVNRRLSNRGNNLTWQGRYSFGNGNNESLNKQMVTYYQLRDSEGNDSIRYRNRYNVTPSKDWSFQTSLTYSERLSKFSFLVLRYMYRYTNRTSDRSTYDFSEKRFLYNGITYWPSNYRAGIDASNFGYDVTPEYRYFGAYLNPFISEADSITLANYYDAEQSRYTEYDNYVHEIELTWRRTTNNYNLNLGVMYQPQSQKLTYKYHNIDTIARRSVQNITPTLDFRYRFNKQKSIRINYRGNTSQPSMTDMLPITDDSDQMNKREGNPELKPSFTQNASLRYQNYVQKRFSSIMAFINYSNTRNSVSNMVQYDEVTGARTTRPENINGNWNISGAFMYNTSLDTLGRWNINTMTNLNYRNNVNYVTLQERDAFGNRIYNLKDRDNNIIQRYVPINNANQIVNENNAVIGTLQRGQAKQAVYQPVSKNYTRSTSINERLGMSYRNDWLEVELNGNVTYNINRNMLNPESNLDTWHFDYGTDIHINAPWGTGFSTSLHMSSRRGYDSKLANTNELIWNVQISQTLLKQKNLTFSLQAYDILNQRSSFSRAIDANSRRDSWSNAINCYGMLHAIYRFNLFGGKA